MLAQNPSTTTPLPCGFRSFFCYQSSLSSIGHPTDHDDDETNLQTPCLSNLKRSIFCFPVIVEVEETIAVKVHPPRRRRRSRRRTSGRRGRPAMSSQPRGPLASSSSPKDHPPTGITFLLLLPVFSLLYRRRRRRPTLHCEETDEPGPKKSSPGSAVNGRRTERRRTGSAFFEVGGRG